MDAEHERVNAKDPLSALFQERGHIAPALDLESKVLARTALTPGRISQAPPLISMRAWMIAGGLLIAAVTFGLLTTTPGSVIASSSFEIPAWLKFAELVELITSRWVLTALAGLATLFLVDHAIRSRQRVFLTL